MPSGAKKRQAAKKKLEKQAHNKSNGSHTKGSEESKFHEERDSDGGEFEREGNVEGGGGKEVRLGEEIVAKDDGVHTDAAATEFSNVTNKSSSSNSSNSSSSSSSSSSSGDDDVVVEKEQPAETELGKAEHSVDESVEESIPMEELVNQVVSLTQESTIVSESVPEGNLSTSDVITSELKENLDEAVQPFDEKIEAGSVMDFLKMKIEEKVVPIVDGGSENTTEPVGVTTRNDEGLLPQLSGVKATEGCCVDDNGKMPETHKYTEEQPLLSSAPVPVRRTSWMNCCGLLEVFSGGSSQ